MGTKKPAKMFISQEMIDDMKAITERTISSPLNEEVSVKPYAYLPSVPTVINENVPDGQVYMFEGKLVGNSRVFNERLPDKYRGMDIESVVSKEVERRLGGACTVYNDPARMSYEVRWRPKYDNKTYRFVFGEDLRQRIYKGMDLVGYVCDQLEIANRRNISSSSGKTMVAGVDPSVSSRIGYGAIFKTMDGIPIGQVIATEMTIDGYGSSDTIEMNVRLRCKQSDIARILTEERLEKEEFPVYVKDNYIPEEELKKLMMNAPSDILIPSPDTEIKIESFKDQNKLDIDVMKKYLSSAEKAMTGYNQSLYEAKLMDKNGNAIAAEAVKFNITEEDKLNFIDPKVLENVKLTFGIDTEETVVQTEICEPYSIAEFIEEAGTV